MRTQALNEPPKLDSAMGRVWVKNPRVKGGGYWRRYKKGKKELSSSSSNPSIVPSSESEKLRFTGERPKPGVMGRVAFVEDEKGNQYLLKEMRMPYALVQGSMEVTASEMAIDAGINAPRSRLIPKGDGKHITKHARGAVVMDIVKGETVGDLKAKGEMSQDFELQVSNIKGFNQKTLDTMKKSDDLAKIAAFDAFTGNWDRHAGNVMKTKDGKYYGIDNGGAFGGYSSFERNGPAIEASKFFESKRREDFSESDLKAIRTYRDTLKTLSENNPPEKTKKKLKGYLDHEGAKVHPLRRIYSKNIDSYYETSGQLIKTLDILLREDGRLDGIFRLTDRFFIGSSR